MDRIDRRRFITVAGALGASIALAACGSSVNRGPALSQSERSPVASPKPQETPIDILKKEIDLLPPSGTKSVLLTRVVRYYQQKPPFNVNFSGIDIPVFDANVEIVNRPLGNNSRAEFTPRLPHKVPTYQSLSDGILVVPLVVGLSDQDKALIPSANKFPDGEPFIQAKISKGNLIETGLAPWISIIRTNNSPITPILAQQERFGYIKEACGLLLYDALTELTAKDMVARGIVTSLDVQDMNGQSTKIETVTPQLARIVNLSGRTMALLDLASYVVAFQAVRATEYHNALLADSTVSNIISILGDTDFGSTSEEIIRNSYAKVLETPAMNQLIHAGDMSSIP